MSALDMAPHGKPMVAANFRLPSAIVDAVDAEVDEVNEAAGYPKVNRSDMIRDLLEEALRARGRLGGARRVREPPVSAEGAPAASPAHAELTEPTRKGKR